MLFIGLTTHVLGAVVWIGGMFFAYVVLRPSSGPLEQNVRLALWSRVLSRFFLWVWISVAALLISGVGLVALGGGGSPMIGSFVPIMMVLGLVMVAIYARVYFAPWRGLRRAVSAADWPAADQCLQKIRRLVGVNLILGLITVAVGVSALLYG